MEIKLIIKLLWSFDLGFSLVSSLRKKCDLAQRTSRSIHCTHHSCTHHHITLLLCVSLLCIVIVFRGGRCSEAEG